MLPSQFSTLIQSLGLSSGFYKPCPSHLNQTALQSIPQQSTPVPEVQYAAQQVHNFSSQVNPRDDQQQNFNTQYDPCYVEPYHVPAPPEYPFDPYDEAKATIFRFRQQQSVNLGSWWECQK